MQFNNHPGEFSDKRVAMIRSAPRTRRSETLTWRPAGDEEWGHTVCSHKQIGCRQLPYIVGRYPRAIEVVLQGFDGRSPIVIGQKSIETSPPQPEHEAPGSREEVDTRQSI
jgi:hypothetical protein